MSTTTVDISFEVKPEIHVEIDMLSALVPPNAEFEKEYDWQPPNLYIGIAPKYTTSDLPLWKITRIVVSADGSEVSSFLENQIWDNRLSLSYP